MPTPEHDQLTALIRHHRPSLRTDPVFERIPTGKFNTSFYVHSDGEDLVLRIAPPRDAVFLFYERDMMRQEPGIHERVREQTDAPVAKIIAYDDSLSLIDRDYILMERLPGAPLTEMPGVDFNGVLRQVGRLLAQVHRLTADHHGYIGAHRPMEPQTDWVSAFHVMWNKLLDDIISVGHYDADEADLLRTLLDRHIEHFQRPVQASLLHMDIWHQNLLVDAGGNLTGIVDWDRALWGDPEIEYAVLDYCGVSEPAFWEGYGAERDTSHPARVRNVFYMLYELQKYIVIRQGRGNDAASAQRYKRQSMAIVQHAFLS